MSIKTVKVCIQDVDTGISNAEIIKVAKALTIQAKEHFSLPPPMGYGISCTVRAASKKKPPQSDEWVMMLLSKPDIEGALGYHDESDVGLPIMKIFPLLDKQDGVSWSSTASHELLETLADPNIAKCAQGVDGKIWAYEVCDGVEGDSYKIGDVEVSNFVLPPYFETPSNWKKLKLDYLGLCKAPLELRPAGYNQYFDATKGWQAVYAEKVSSTKMARIQAKLSRVSRR